MKSPLHLDLLKEEERLSSSPIRLRVLLPLITTFFLLCALLVWGLFEIQVLGKRKLMANVENAVKSVTPVHAAVLASRDQEKEMRAGVQQLSLYKHARNVFGPTLSIIAAQVPTNIQFTEMRIFPPQTASEPSRSVNPPPAPTNTLERVSLRIAGRTKGSRASESVNDLMAALQTAAFTNVFRSVSIPKGAFRLDTSRNQSALTANESLLFEITCECEPRRFE